MKRKILAVLLVSLMLLLMTACGGSSASTGDASAPAEGSSTGDAGAASGDVVVIHYPTFQTGVNTAAPVVDKLIEEFNAEYEGKYQIQKEDVPGDQNYTDKIKLQLGTNDLPPVVYGGGYNLLDLALQQDLVVDLTEHVEADPEWKALYSDVAMATNSRDGKIYASSSEGSVIGYFYNKELFEQAGIEGPASTWEEFFEQCETLKAAGITPLSMDTADSGWVTMLWWGAMVGTASDAGLEFMQQMNPSDYNTPEMIEAVGNIQKMLQEYTTIDAIGGKYEHAANNFLSGQTAMIANGPWMMGDFSDTTKTTDDFADKVGTAIYPEGFVYDAPIQGYFVTKQDDPAMEEAAIEMVKFFTNAHAQQTALELQGMVPASSTVEVSDAAKENFPLLAGFLDQTAEATKSSDNLQATMYTNLLDAVSQELPQLYSGDLTPEAFCQMLSDEAQKNVTGDAGAEEAGDEAAEEAPEEAASEADASTAGEASSEAASSEVSEAA